jgi:hypothetical protein
MENNQDQQQVIAFCGLYCSNCSAFHKKKCPGCLIKTNASWCKIRTCCISKEIANCAYCSEYSHVKSCEKYSNFFAKAIEFVSRTDRSLCIKMIKEQGEFSFSSHMDQIKKISMPKQKKK